MQGLKKVETSKVSEKRAFRKYDIINNGQYKFVKRRKCEPVHEKLGARTQSTSMLQ